MRKQLETYARLGYYEGYWSPWIIAEVTRVLTWRWIRQHGMEDASMRSCSRSAKLMMGHLEATLHIVRPIIPYPLGWPTLGDSDDRPIWAAAKAIPADYVVSDNRSDFPLSNAQGAAEYQGTIYITSRDFIAGIENGTI